MNITQIVAIGIADLRKAKSNLFYYTAMKVKHWSDKIFPCYVVNIMCNVTKFEDYQIYKNRSLFDDFREAL